jgi:acetyl/propionyl-CoA carboxylase alpha subunit/WD40 repeat protein
VISSLLVANRGEIARRIFRSCRAAGIATVAVFSDPDGESPHVADADRAVRLPGASSAETYLNADAIVAAASAAGADAVHPGYGFLAEDPAFARLVLAAGLTWVGPPPGAMDAMALKTHARKLASAAGVPVLPELDPDSVRTFPVLVKASAGGGGRGMRAVHAAGELAEAIESARREARAAFGDGTVFCEPLVTGARHIEVQVLADQAGTVWALTERDCSVQRRYAKVIEETPSPVVGPALRERLQAAATALARAVGYVNAGTVEFLVAGDGSGQDGEFYFLEFNTRLQVEHPVTECVHGIDLVALQLAIAEGTQLPATPPEAAGHAIEARLYAEDPADGYRPSAGPVHAFAVAGTDAAFGPPSGRWPCPFLRVDAGVEPGSIVSTHYDAMLAKVIAWAPTRAAAVRRLAAGLAGVLVVALAATGLAVNYQRAAAARALESEANRLAALSTTVGSLDLSLLLAAQANRLADTPETQDGLLSALLLHRRAARVVAFDDDPTGNSELAAGNLFFSVGDEVATWKVDSTSRPHKIIGSGYWDVQLCTPSGCEGWGGSDASPVDAAIAGGGMWDGVPLIRVQEPDYVEEFPLAGPGIPLDVSYRSDGRRLLALVATPDPAGSRRGWRWRVNEVDLVTQQIRPLRATGTFPGTQEWPRVRFSKDGSSLTLSTAEGGGSASWVDVRTGRPTSLQVWRRNSATVDVKPLSGALAAQLWADGALALYDRTGRRVQLIDDGQEAISDVVMSPDGTWGATAGDQGGVQIWAVDAGSGRWTRRETLHGHSGKVTDLEVDPTGRLLLSVSSDGTVISWDMSPDAGFGSSVPGLTGWWIANRPELTPDGRLLVAPTQALSRRPGTRGIQGGPADDTLAVAATFIDPVTGRVVDRAGVGDTINDVDFGSSVAVSPDGTKVAVTSGLRTTVLDTRTRRELGRIVLPAPPGNVDHFGNRFSSEVFPSEVVWCSAWSPDGSRLLIGAEGPIRQRKGGIVVVDAATWKPERRLEIGAPQYIEYSPDRKTIAVSMAETNEVKILDATSYDVLHTLFVADDDEGPDLSFSPDGTRLAAGGVRGELYVWDTTTWKPRFGPLMVHNARLMQVEWIDNRTVVSSGMDGTVTMVDTIRGRIRAEPLPGSSVPGPGYTHLVPGTSDELVVLSGERPGHRYALNPATWLAEVCTVVGRDLTTEEWARYIPELDYRKTCTDLLAQSDLSP